MKKKRKMIIYLWKIYKISRNQLTCWKLQIAFLSFVHRYCLMTGAGSLEFSAIEDSSVDQQVLRQLRYLKYYKKKNNPNYCNTFFVKFPYIYIYQVQTISLPHSLKII